MAHRGGKLGIEQHSIAALLNPLKISQPLSQRFKGKSVGISRLARRIERKRKTEIAKLTRRAVVAHIKAELAGEPLCKCDYDVRRDGDAAAPAVVCAECGLPRLIVLAKGGV